MATGSQGGGGTRGYQFQREIKCMMYSFGDVKNPSNESALLVEEITLSETRALVQEVSKVTQLRGSKTMTVDDLLFVLRKNKTQMQMVLHFLGFKEIVKKANVPAASDDEDAGASDSEAPFPAQDNKKRKYSLDFLSSADQDEVLNVDKAAQLHRERLERHDSVTKDMDEAQYMDYVECRRISFYKSNTSKFKEWIDFPSLTSFRPSQQLVDLFGYMAYEIVQRIVNLSLIVKREQENRSSDPVSMPRPPRTLPPSKFGAVPTFVSIPMGPGTAAAGEAQQTPTSPRSPSTTKPMSPAHILNRPPNRPKKRGRPPKNQPPAATADVATPPSPPTAIHPAHIREALRRHSTRCGPLKPFSTHFSRSTFTAQSLCL